MDTDVVMGFVVGFVIGALFVLFAVLTMISGVTPWP